MMKKIIFILLSFMKISSAFYQKCTYIDSCSILIDGNFLFGFLGQIDCKVKPASKFNQTAYESSLENFLNFYLFNIYIYDRIVLGASASYIFDVLKYAYIEEATVFLIGLAGINSQSPLRLPTEWKREITVSFYDTKLVYYDDSSQTIQTCQDFERLNTSQNHLIHWNRSSSRQKLNIKFSNVQFPKPICDLAYKNVRLNEIDFGMMM